MSYNKGHYCPVCGYIMPGLTKEYCQRCWPKKKMKMLLIPEEYGINTKAAYYIDVTKEEYNRRKQFFHDDFLVNQPGFDDSLYWNQKSDEDKRVREQDKRDMEEVQQNWDNMLNKNNPAGVRCRYCGSSNCKKISGLARGLSVGLFGLRSKAIGKQWHCNNCGSDF